MTGPDAAPTVEDMIAEAVEAEIRQYVIPRGPNGAIGWGATPQTIAAAVVAAIRGMTVETLAELIGGELIDRVTFGGRRIRYVCSPPEHLPPRLAAEVRVAHRHRAASAAPLRDLGDPR